MSSRPPSPATAPPAESVGPPSSTAPEALIRLDRPFDVDEFAGMLGETAIRVTVPAESLTEVLRRVTDFMGFGVYVYAISVRPAPAELLKGFVVELHRVEFDHATGTWRPFVERGVVASSGGDFPPQGRP